MIKHAETVLVKTQHFHKTFNSKFPKYSDAWKICCNYPRILTMWLYHRVTSPKDADGITNSVDPDLGAVSSGSTLFAQAFLSENLGPLRYFRLIWQWFEFLALVKPLLNSTHAYTLVELKHNIITWQIKAIQFVKYTLQISLIKFDKTEKCNKPINLWFWTFLSLWNILLKHMQASVCTQFKAI